MNYSGSLHERKLVKRGFPFTNKYHDKFLAGTLPEAYVHSVGSQFVQYLLHIFRNVWGELVIVPRSKQHESVMGLWQFLLEMMNAISREG